MCGRFTQTSSAETISETFNLTNIPTQVPRYNIAPTQPVATILHPNPDSERQFQELRWGLIPSWAKEKNLGVKLINARAETVAEKPSFRSAFRRRRCLIIADGFYEWQLQNGQKQPFYFHLKAKGLFAFAGLWETWQAPEGEIIKSCTIITTTAHELMASIHQRMPVILEAKDYDLWLDPQVTEKELLQPLLIPYDAKQMSFYPVSTKVNNAKNNVPDCLKPI